MESIRAAMGVEKLDYIGYSYGTSLGSVFATLYPTSVGNLILTVRLIPLRMTTPNMGSKASPSKARLIA